MQRHKTVKIVQNAYCLDQSIDNRRHTINALKIIQKYVIPKSPKNGGKPQGKATYYKSIVHTHMRDGNLFSCLHSEIDKVNYSKRRDGNAHLK